MKKIIVMLCLIAFTVVPALAGSVNSYQVTGPVLEVKDDMIVVQKGKEKWEIAKDKDTKIMGNVKVGDKVTVKYTMKAVSIEGKAEKKKAEKKK